MRILLTGATGYVGGRLLPVLEARGHEVRCLARDPANLASRVGASLLNVVGLSDVVAGTREQYVNRAVELASDPARLQRLRQTLRQRMQPLLDGARLAREVEHAYRQAWQNWCQSPNTAR